MKNLDFLYTACGRARDTCEHFARRAGSQRGGRSLRMSDVKAAADPKR